MIITETIPKKKLNLHTLIMTKKAIMHTIALNL